MTHCFHPLSGREFELVTCKQVWGEDRVFYKDTRGRLGRMPVGWTSIAKADAFQVTAAGRCQFRTDDLLRLVDLIEALRSSRRTKRS